jgi:hypothetical protein
MHARGPAPCGMTGTRAASPAPRSCRRPHNSPHPPSTPFPRGSFERQHPLGCRSHEVLYGCTVVQAEPYDPHLPVAHGNRFQCARSKSQSQPLLETENKPRTAPSQRSAVFLPQGHRPANRTLRAFLVSNSPAQNRPRRRAFRHRSEALFIVATRRLACRFADRSPCVSHRAPFRVSPSVRLPPTCLRTACRLRVRCASQALRRLRVRVPSALRSCCASLAPAGDALGPVRPGACACVALS